ncbi:hypothetical protein C1645_841965 [Glomus cerebriforme]|uniref:Crinkler effector protein N-terminal domain-containing protein n=1 Tax=Glomus cerebriforme TaxID=658196 RepID=A0A397S085_9GLOM|nr:hypothetical protein C1645_841965 [Glomus cerebriforme]
MSQNKESKMSRTFTCFVRNEANKDIFNVTIDRDLTVNDLKAKIKTIRQDLEEINIELYRKDFLQENVALINTVNTDRPEKRQGVWMDPQKKISQCFFLGEENIASPFPLEEGKIIGLRPINIIIYPQVELEKKPSDTGL